jgi:hypothetical protein
VEAPPPNAPNALGVSVPIDPGLVAVGPPNIDPVPRTLPFVVPLAFDIPNPDKVGFFFDDPDNPRMAGWFGFILVEGSRVGLFGGTGLLSPPGADDVPGLVQKTIEIPNRDIPLPLRLRFPFVDREFRALALRTLESCALICLTWIPLRPTFKFVDIPASILVN